MVFGIDDIAIIGLAGIAGTFLGSNAKTASGGENTNGLLGGWFSTNSTKKEQNTYSSSVSSADQFTNTFTNNPVTNYNPNFTFNPQVTNNSPYATLTSQANPSSNLSNAPTLDLSALIKQAQSTQQTPTMTTGSGTASLLDSLTNPTTLVIIGGIGIGAYLFLKKKK